MQKRVLAFLMAMVIVFSLLPVALVGAETEPVEAGYSVVYQKAHNQTEGFLAIDIYLQAKNAEQGLVTGYQFKVTPAEGLQVTGVEKCIGSGEIAANGGEEGLVIYQPGENTGIAVGTDRVRVATVTVKAVAEGATLPAQAAEAFTLSEVTVTQPNTDPYTVTEITAKAVSDVWADVTGEWQPLDTATVKACQKESAKKADGTANTSVNGYKLPAGNYFLVEDLRADTTTIFANVNLDLNGYDIDATNAGVHLLALDGFLNLSDSTATGSALDGTLEAGTIVATNKGYGGALYASYNSVINVSNVNIDGSAVNTQDCGSLLYCLGNGTVETMKKGIIHVENVYLFGGKAKADAATSVDMVEVRGDLTMKDVRFENFDVTPNAAKSATKKNCLVGCLYNGTDGNIVMENVVANDCSNYFMYIDDKRLDSVTVKGNTSLVNPIYLESGAEVILDLGENAEVTLKTEKDLTTETIGTAVKVAEGGKITAGTVLYENAGAYVTYKDGVLDFSSHAHDDVSFKVWTDSSSLPTKGNWYLETDVVLTEPAKDEDGANEAFAYQIARGDTLNLDLNGHTISKDSDKLFCLYEIEGTLNLFDCAEQYNAEGQWTGGKITDFDNKTGGTIRVGRGTAGGAKTTRGVFNMYGGRIENCGNTADGTSGGAVYIMSSRKLSGKANEFGGEFNMYGGELYNNATNDFGGAVTVWGLSKTVSPSSAIVEEGKEPMGATFNMYGGKIHGNKSEDGGAICIYYDAILNVYGGEISGNSATSNGGAVRAMNAGTTVNISGGTFSGNTSNGTGGAISVNSNCVLTITGGTFSGNVAGSESTAGRGGAIYCGSADATITVCGTAEKPVLFDGNSAADNATKSATHYGCGGAIHIADNDNTDISYATFKNNTATRKNTGSDYAGMGAAIYGKGGITMDIDHCTFTNNSTNRNGGAIAFRDDDGVLNVSDCVITENTALHGGAIYMLSKTQLNLENTTITKNTTTSGDSGAIYITGHTGTLVASGKTVIADNIKTTLENSDGSKLYYHKGDVFVQPRSNTATPPSREMPVLYVDELADGSRINVYFDEADSAIFKSGDANQLFAVKEGGTQSNWECGWVTYFKTTAKANIGQNVSYVNGQFTFGHFHGEQEYTAVTSMPTDFSTLTAAADGKYYVYLAGGVKTAEYNPTSDLTVCLNGQTWTGSDSTKKTIKLKSGKTLTIEDCSEHFLADGTYEAGTLTSTTKSGYGAAIRIHNGTVILNSGRVADIKPDTGADRSGMLVYLYHEDGDNATTDANNKPKFVMNGGYLGNFDLTHASANATYGMAIYARRKTISSKNYDPTVELNGGIIGDITHTKNGTTAGASHGSVVYGAGNITVKNVTFQNITIKNNTKTTAADGKVTGATTYGGVLYVSGAAPVIENCKFINIETASSGALEGGVVYVTGATGSKPSVKDCRFENTKADSTVNGTVRGAVIMTNKGDISVTGSTFINCQGVGTGSGSAYGMFYTKEKDVTAFDDNTFKNCSVDGNGGVVYCEAADIKSANNLTVENCSAAQGGVFYITGVDSDLFINGGTFTGNQATTTSNDTGGAVIRTAGTNNTVTIGKYNGQGTVIADNSCAAQNGGVMLTANATQVTIDGATITGNTAKYGGVMVLWGGSSVDMKDTTITENITTSGSYGAVGLGSKSGLMSTLTVSGKVVIDGNTNGKGEASNVSFREEYTSIIEIGADGLATESSIGVRAQTGRTNKGYFEVSGAITADQAKCFHSDMDGYVLGVANGALPVLNNVAAAKPTTTAKGEETEAQYQEIKAKVDSGEYLEVLFRTNTVSGTDYHYVAGYVAPGTEAVDHLIFANSMVGDKYFGSIEDAVEEAKNGGVIVALVDSTKAATVKENVVLDLNGKALGKITVADGKTLSLIDTTTNDYDCADGYGTVTVDGAYKAFVEDRSSGSLKRYAVIETDGKLSAHRIYLSINSKTLRPYNRGVGYKAIFAGDEVVANSGITYGIQLSGYANFDDGVEGNKDYLAASFTTMTAGIEGTSTPNQKIVVITDAVTAENHSRWNATLYGRPFMTINGETFYGATVEVNMKDMAKNALASGNETVIAAVNAMMEACGVSVN